jgi:hypothetical protein
MRWDARIGCYRAPALCYRDIVTSFRARGVTYQDDVRTKRVQTGPWREVALRPYKHAALLAWDREKRGLFVMPTGSGKTRLACAAMAACHVPALCLVPTRSLLHQWRNEIACHYGGATGCLGDGTHTIEDITVATFEGAYRQMPRLGHRFGLLVMSRCLGTMLGTPAFTAPGMSAAPGSGSDARTVCSAVAFSARAGNRSGEAPIHNALKDYLRKTRRVRAPKETS